MTASTLPPLIQQMLEPDFYPHAVSESPIRLLQTHVSYVLLTGEFVYKLKKPVNFGFLDYSTLDKRQHFCQEEIRLNQRTAAELYLDIVPITADGDRFVLGGEGKPVEYALKLKQFPQSALLTAVFDRGELTPALMVRLAQEIASFHAKTATNDYIRGFGEIPSVRQSIDENYDQTVSYIGGPQTQAQFEQTKAYTDEFFVAKADLFQQRIQQDKIRECHGDLHLRNIALWGDRLWLFDCIEFNEPFRFVDTMFDIAYIVMDLAARDRWDLNNVFLNAYFEATGDWEGLEILPLYVSRQSYVRAKVTSFLLGDPAIPADEKAKITETAAQYYTLANEITQTKPGQILVTAGLSGSGKSTLAKGLAPALNAIHLRSDAVRKHLAGIPLDQRGDDSLYTPEMSMQTYDRLQQLGITLAQAGYTVILDAKYDRQATRLPLIAAAKTAELPLTILHCQVDLDTMRDRVQQRTGDIADATVAILAKQTFEPLTAVEQAVVKTVDTTPPVAAVVGQALATLT